MKKKFKRKRVKKRYSYSRLRRRLFFLLVMGIILVSFKFVFKNEADSESDSDRYETAIRLETSRNKDVSRNYSKAKKENMGTIAIDPGHGGVDSGAVDDKGLMEKDINLDICLDLKKQFESEGFKTIMTREEDRSLEDFSDVQRSRYIRDIYARTDILNGSKADAFVSVHVNASEDTSIRGIRVHYYPTCEDGKELAESICRAVNENSFLNRNTIEAKALPENYHLTREVEYTGVLIEVGFISNSEDNRLLRDSRYKKEVAYAIKDGMLEYVESFQKTLNKNANQYRE